MSRQAGWLAQIGLYNDCYALSAYLSVFSVWVVPGGHFCRSGVLTLSGMFCRSRLCVWGLAIGGMSIGAVASSYLARGTSQTPGCLCCWCHGSRRSLFLLLFLLFCEAVRGFPCFP